jgi:predicted AlkP superfamily phosphohydrolase/phosphomutase
MVMMTGKNPGELAIYGFKHRRGYSYDDGYIVNSTNVHERTVWEILSSKGRRSVILGVPPGYPPKQVSNVTSVSCFMTPSQERPFTYPEELRDEVIAAAGGKYIFDVTFRTDDREEVRKELFEMTEKRFDVAEYLARNKPWEFFMMHEIGFDRLHHAFWKFFDPSHPKYVKASQYGRIDEEYYQLVDRRIGALLPILGDDCTTLIVSDHGSKAMLGAFCINQWLEREGYLTFKARPSTPTELDKTQIDWSRTKAWGWGGYYARIFFNVRGREREGIIPQTDLDREKKTLVEKLMSIKDDGGRPMKNAVFEPAKLYGIARGDKPDLMVYLDDLNWRSAGTVGHPSLYLFENDTGPDDSVHSMDGVLMMHRPGHDMGGRELKGASAQDIAPTLMKMLGLDPAQEKVGGRVIREIVEAASR